jgi:hypothetical protein
MRLVRQPKQLRLAMAADNMMYADASTGSASDLDLNFGAHHLSDSALPCTPPLVHSKPISCAAAASSMEATLRRAALLCTCWHGTHQR